MSALLARMQRDSGQAMLFVVLALGGLTSAWPRSSSTVARGSARSGKLQTAADAAALAGAQELPLDQGAAQTNAISYAQQNSQASRRPP